MGAFTVDDQRVDPVLGMLEEETSDLLARPAETSLPAVSQTQVFIGNDSQT